MGIFNPTASNISTAPFVADPDDYRLNIYDLSVRTLEAQGETKAIFTVTFRFRNGQYEGKPIRQDHWVGKIENNEFVPDMEAIGGLFKVVYAALGINPGTKAADEQFRNDFAGLDLSWDAQEKKVLGDWDRVKGNDINATLGQKANKTGDRVYQTFANIRPAE